MSVRESSLGITTGGIASGFLGCFIASLHLTAPQSLLQAVAKMDDIRASYFTGKCNYETFREVRSKYYLEEFSYMRTVVSPFVSAHLVGSISGSISGNYLNKIKSIQSVLNPKLTTSALIFTITSLISSHLTKSPTLGLINGTFSAAWYYFEPLSVRKNKEKK